MIATQPKTNIVTTGIQGAVSFGIKNEGLAHIFNVLRNQLYSDKILAVLREYSCNAVDAHVEAGHPEKPIKVTLPSRMNLNLKIRDFGLGLTEKDIQDIYAYYGESTKRNSNALIGQLGLGSKSAFAYGDNFVINSFCDGSKTTYNAYIDASQVGQIAKLASAPTDEPNGVEIVIPVRPNDIEQFSTKAAQIYKHFAVRPDFDGQTLDFKDEEPIMKGNGWTLFAYNQFHSVPTAVMGNIGYALNADSLKLQYNDNDDTFRNILRSGLVVKFNIGDLDIAASREGLQYTEKTINAIKSKLSSIKDEMTKQASDSLKDAPSLFSFKRMLCKFNDLTNPYYIVSKCIKNFTWKGKKVDSYLLIDKADDEAVIRYNPRKGYVGNLGYIVKGGDLTSNMGGNKISLSGEMVVIENTKKVSSGLVNYAFNYLKDNKQVLIVTFKDAAHRKAAMDRLGLCDNDLIDIKTLEKITLPRSTRSRTGQPSTAVKSKHLKKMFALKSNPPSYTSVQSDYWEEIDVDINDQSTKDNYVWVEINKFAGVINNEEGIGARRMATALSLTNKIIQHFDKKSKASAVKLLGVKKDKVNEIKNSGVPHISAFVKDQLIKLESDTNFSEELLELEAYHNFSSYNPVLTRTLEKIDSKQAPNADKLRKIVSGLSHSPTIVQTNKDFYAVCQTLSIELKSVMSAPSAQLKTNIEKITAFADKFKIFRIVDDYSLMSYRENHKQNQVLCAELVIERDGQLASIV